MENLDERTIDVLFAIIRAAFDVSIDEVHITQKDVLEIERIASRQNIMYIIITGLKKMGCSELLTERMGKFIPKAYYDFFQRKESLQEVMNALDESQIPYIPLKGSILRSLYPDPCMRTSSDIDVLVNESDIEDAVKSVEEKTSFNKDAMSYHNVSLVNKRIHLELHFNIKENDEKTDRLLSLAWDFANRTATGYRYVFTPEYEIFYTLAHMKHHFVNGGLGIRPFLDLWLLRNRTKYNGNLVEELMSKCGILKFYTECSYLSEVWLGNKKHTETSLRFEEFCLSGGVFGSEKFMVAAQQRNKRGWKYVASRVFPPKYQVKEFYKTNDGKEHTASYYYAKRLRSWISKNRRSEFKRRVGTALKSDKNYQDKANELFSRLGLR